jgi:predicted lysophospholipase L1 biosynthesis ABC-type transport system permease subunit
MEALTLYTRYAFRSFLRARSRSVFGAFCVAVGIAAVVALGLAGGNFRNTITTDAQKQNRGDVLASPAGVGFTFEQMRIFDRLKARGQIVDYTSRYYDDAMLRNPGNAALSAVGGLSAVDPRKFPFYDTITADQPAGVPLATLLHNPRNAVVSHDAFDSLHLHLGDTLIVNSRRGFDHRYTVAGIVPDNAPSPGFGAGFWNDFAMVNQSSALPFFRSLDIAANAVYMTTRNPAQAAHVKTYLQGHLGGFPLIKTAADTAKDSKNSADGFDTFFRIMGLVAVVIGGIGIINTMLVAARRRIHDIAILKSLGMKGRHVVFIFTVEALLLAVCGTVLGILLGIGASALVTSVTASLAGFAIPWSLQARPLIAGAASASSPPCSSPTSRSSPPVGPAPSPPCVATRPRRRPASESSVAPAGPSRTSLSPSRWRRSWASSPYSTPA